MRIRCNFRSDKSRSIKHFPLFGMIQDSEVTIASICLNVSSYFRESHLSHEPLYCEEQSPFQTPELTAYMVI